VPGVRKSLHSDSRVATVFVSPGRHVVVIVFFVVSPTNMTT
jgi:hypothetical protein